MGRMDRIGGDRSGGGQWQLWVFLIIAIAAVLGAWIVRLTHWRTGMLGPYAGAATLLLGFSITFSAFKNSAGWRRALIGTGLILVCASAAELWGIYTGFPFGAYEYTKIWWPYVLIKGSVIFPLLLPLSWFILVACCYALVRRRYAGWAVVLGTGLTAAILDVPLEPVMTGPVHFWRWNASVSLYNAPLENFAGWFLVSSCAAGLLEKFGGKEMAKDSRLTVLLFAVLIMTIAIGCIHLYWEALIGVPVLIAFIYLARGGRALA